MGDDIDLGGGRPLVAAAMFFSGATFVPARLGSFLREEGHVRVGHDGRLYRYDEGVFVGDGDRWARARVRELLGDACRRRHFDEVLTWLRAELPSLNERPDSHLLNLRNGMLNWRLRDLGGHSPAFGSTIQLPIGWNPEAQCPAIRCFLDEILPDDALDFVLELVGYTLYTGNPMRKAVLLLGPGKNGKSVFLGIIRALLGDRNVAAVPLQMLAENRFAGAELYGKLANISGDLDARAVRRTDLFKMATGGDPIMAERKNGHPFNFVPFALPLFSANEAPISSDQSEAWFDRWLIVPLERRFTEDQVDVQLLRKLTSNAELEGLLVEAVFALARLMERGRFVPPPTISAAGERYRDRLDTVRAFVGEECVVHFECWTPRAALYKSYQQWARDGGRIPVSAVTFNDHLRSNHPELEERIRRGIRGWAGLGLAAMGGAG